MMRAPAPAPALALLLLGCWCCCSGSALGAAPAAAAAASAASLDFGSVPGGVYETVAYYEPGPIGLLFNMMRAFLHVVQPNPFPQDLVIQVAKDKFGAIKSEYQKPENIVLTLQVIYYELGFVVCAVMGILFIVLVPLVGLLFCMCRCCDNCGGEMHQRQRKNADCQRGLLTTLLLTTTFIITAGVLCAYAANQNLSSQLKTVRRLVSSNLRDLYTLANNTPAQVDYLISQYGTAKNQVLCDLDNVGQLLGGRIHEELGKVVLPALDEAQNMAGVIQDTKEALENVTVTLAVLQEGTAQLQSNLSRVRMDITNALDDPACADLFSHTVHICVNILSSLSQLEISANYSALPGVSEQLAKVNNVLKTNLSQIVHKGYLAFSDTPTMVTNQTKNVAEGVRGLLDGTGNNITRFSKLFPVQTTVNNVTIFISHTHSQIEDLYPEIDKMDFYRWIGCITLCCMVALILAFNFLGLLCGILGFDRHASPTTRGCVSNTGGNLLMAGVGFSFMFSWVLMGVVTVTFVVGGNVEKLVCEPFHSRELFKVLDTPNLVNPSWKHFIPGYLYNDPEIDLTVENIYSNCKENHGIYSALHLDKVFNISALLNTSLYTKDVSKKFDGVKVDLKTIVLLNAEGKDNLINFTEAGIKDIDFAAYIEELNKGVTRVDLLSFANDLDTQADQLTKGPVQTSIKGHANTLRQIHTKQVIPLQQSMKYVSARNTLNQSIRFLERTASDLTDKISEILQVVDSAQYLISHNATFIVNQESEKYKQTIIGYFKQYINWIKTSLMTEVATCKPVSNIIDTAEILACGFFLDSMNTFWFGLGCSALFLLPSIILSVRLAKFYRRMDTEDVYDDIDTIPMKTMEIGNNGYYNEHIQGIQNPVMSSLPAYDTMTRFPRASAPPRHGDW
ncbi:prominin-1-A isoform X1 [Pangasianodon hypophthalmus]|uniref:prominin-1-A isoform X1 n=1 Tax=Pangasianodon hypophthalmus TaxID=310915 RepID=UPI000EFDF539|nr:prominin-1-A isoform X1 [Pangasianodon hypophthalmus]